MNKKSWLIIGGIIMVGGIILAGFLSVNLKAQAPILFENDLVKTADSSSVWLMQNGKKRVFPHISVYNSWSYPADFSTVKTVTDLSEYPGGDPVSLRDCSVFRGTATSVHGKEASCVFLVSDGKLRPIKSAEVYQAMFNDPNWERVVWIPDDYLSKFVYALDAMIESTDTHANGCLIRYSGQLGVYLIEDGKKRAIISNQAFEDNNFSWSNVITIDPAETYPDGSVIDKKEDNLVIPGGGTEDITPPSNGCILPSAPVLTDPGVTVLSGMAYSLSWSQVSGATSYTLEQDTNNLFTNPSVAYQGSLFGTSPSQTVTIDTTYYYRVKTTDSCGDSLWSNVVDIQIQVSVPVVPPGKPIFDVWPVAQVTGGNSFQIGWGSVSTATGYTLQRDIDSNLGNPTDAYTGASNSHTDTLSPVNNITYYYRVKATNSAGDSAWSETINVAVSCTLPATPVLTVPGASVPTDTNFQLDWTSVSGATSYILEIDNDESFSPAIAVHDAGAATSYVDQRAVSGTYYYRVRATNACGNSPWSDVGSMTITAVPVPPAAPTLDDPGNINYINIYFTLNWSAVEDADSYTVQWDDDPLFGSPATSEISGATSDVIVHFVPATYSYRVRASNEHGDSDWSNSVSMLVIALITNVPDTNQPPTNIMGQPMVMSFCSPIATVNVTEYWDTVMADANAQNVNAVMGPATAAEYIGWFMNTNTFGSIDRFPAGWHPGTMVIDIIPGLLDYVIWEGDPGPGPNRYGFDIPLAGPGVPLAGKSSYVSWDVTMDDIASVGTPDVAWDNYVAEINAGRPTVFSFSFWNPIPNPANEESLDLDDEKGIDFYYWGDKIYYSWEAELNPGEQYYIEEEWWPEPGGQGIGHSVTGIGYLENWNGTDYALVWDNWPTTPNIVAVPWIDPASGGGCWWRATTYIQPQPNAVPEIPVLVDPGVSIISGNNYNITWERVQGASSYCYQWSTSLEFGDPGACLPGGTTSIPGQNTSANATTYYYRVQACNDLGCSGYSNVVDMIVTTAPLRLVPDTYATIQAAINAAIVNDIVYVKSGTYQGNIVLKNSMSLIGEHPATTILDGGGSGHVVTGAFGKISGFTIQNGDNGIYHGGVQHLTITNNIIKDNGNGIYINNEAAHVHVYNNVVIDNQYNGIYHPNAMAGFVVADYYNNIVTQNDIGIWGCAGIWLNYNDIWGNIRFNYHLVNPDPNDIAADPKFVNKPQDDYHLKLNSPCINAGNPFVFYNDPDGTRNDVGVYGGPSAKP